MAPGHDEPSDYWLSNLPANTPLTGLVRLAKSRWRVEHDYRELKTAPADPGGASELVEAES